VKVKTFTIRIDAQSHSELIALAALYEMHWDRRISKAAIVRMGITLLAKDLNKRLSNDKPSTTSA